MQDKWEKQQGGFMASALMELMKPEVEKYAQDYARKRDVERIKVMIRHGDDNEYIKLIMDVTDSEIDALRKDIQ